MIKRIFTNTSKTITGAALILGSASFISRIIALIRDRIFAHQFGAGNALDIYYASFKIPDLIFNLLIVGGISAGFIPIFTTKLGKRKNKTAWALANNIITIVGVSLAIVCLLFFIFMPYIMPYIVPGFDTVSISKTVSLSRLMIISPFLLGLSSILNSMLQSMKHFLVYALTAIVYNIGIIIGAIFFVPYFGIVGLAFGVILGALFHLTIQIPTLYHQGFRYAWSFHLKDKDTIKIGKLMIPRTLTLASNQLNIFVMTILASTLAEGSITVFTFASNLQFVPVGIIGLSFAIAAFPVLSEFAAKHNTKALRRHISQTTKKIIFFMLPLTIIFLLLRAQIVRVIYGSGKFDWTDTIATADTLAFFSLSLIAQCITPLLARAFYAMHNTKTPLIIGFIGTLISIIASLVLKESYGLLGLAMAFSISAIFQLIALWFALRQKLKTLMESTILPALYKMGIAGIFMAAITQLIKTYLGGIVEMTSFFGIFTQGVIAGMGGLSIYAILLLIMKSEEMLHVTHIFKKRWLKLRNIEAIIPESEQR
ncbi:murein biosynthesis integral membrane protein MurJ [Patescibacteria group bacterium]|nr:murein biosynthesis integral membrane protein MurJ [Patescibacteria group bacterium]MBU1721716.1 murein biosynthesis integral membrane protein MurJ [Patescibacteria group bacterium]MBU1901871.1 murein biosynthesis integral membrane protein MurJ [Patescibacteria group bacterium]